MFYAGPDTTLGALRGIEADLDQGVLTVALNRPTQRNAMNIALTLDMERLLEAVARDTAVRVVVLSGLGDGFCAGMDLADFLDATQHDEPALRAARKAADHWRYRLLRLLPQPVIAMVHGFCHGGAVGIVEGCDIAFAADNAEFAMAEAEAGQILTGAVAKAASRVMLPRAVAFHALSARRFNGREAERNGLVTCSFPAAELERETRTLARELVEKDASVLQLTKETLQHVGTMSWDAALSYNAAKVAELKSLQAGQPSPRAVAVQSFLAGKSKPGLGG
jgi:feruloyl-CoA hydratase/lyase